MFTSTRSRNRAVSHEQQEEVPIHNHYDFTSIPETSRFIGTPATDVFTAHVEWSKSCFHSVAGLEKLPEQAKKLCNATISQDAVPTASFDPKAQLAAIADSKEIIVWKLGQGSVPSYLYNFDLPFHCPTPPRVNIFALKGTSRIEGYSLFACSADGNMAVWNSLSYHRGNCTQHQISLKLGETITALSDFFDGKFVAGSSSGEIYIIDIQYDGSISVASLRKRNSMLQRVGSWLTGVNNNSPLRAILSARNTPLIRGKHEEILKIHMDPRPSRLHQSEAIVLSGQSILRCNIEASNRSKILNSIPIYDKIMEQLRLKISIGVTDYGFLDFAIERSGKLVILVAFREKDAHGYALIITSNIAHNNEADGDTLMDDPHGTTRLEDIIKLEYTDDGLQNVRPSLILPNGGPIVIVHLGSLIIYRHIYATMTVEERIGLRNPNENILLQWRNAKENAWSRDDEPIARVQLLTSQAGLLEFTVDINKISELLTLESTGSESGHYNTLVKVLTKSHLEQAVFYESKPNNPLTFPLNTNSVTYTTVLAQSAIELSKEIVSGESAYLVPRLDLHEHLLTRVSALKALMECIYKNGFNSQTGVIIPSELCTNFETMNAASALWTLITNYPDNTHVAFKIASAAIPAQLKLDEGANDENKLRIYLKTQSNTIPQLIVNVGNMVSAATHPLAAEIGRAELQLASNSIVLTVFKSVHEARLELEDMYLGEDLARTEPWTSNVEIVKALKSIFFASLPLIQPSPTPANSAMAMEYEEERQPSPHRQISSVLSKQTTELGDVLLKAAYLQHNARQRQGRKAKKEQDKTSLKDLQSLVIIALNQIGQSEIAIQFAEEYQVFDKLIQVLNPIESSSAMSRTNHFAEKYGDSFVKLLFDWFINSGHEAELLQLGDQYNAQLSKYLEETHLLKLSWMHDVRLKKYDTAFQSLERIAESEPVLIRKKNLLSTAKLIFMASYEQVIPNSLDVYKAAPIQNIDRALKIISVQEEMLREFNGLLEGHSHNTINEKAAAITEELCTKLTDNEWKNLKMIFNYLTRLILEGKMLTEEGLVDILTLKDNRPSQSNNYVTALKLYSNAKSVLPPERSLAMLNTIWRRIYTNDRWDDINAFRQTCSDEQLVVQLRQTTAYRVLNRCRDQNIQDVLKPRQIQLGPVKWDIKIRFPEIISASNIESVAGDLRSEQFELAVFIEKCRLEDFVTEILLQVK
ncbi:Non-repetitive/WGA-negative nucleoporin C-terminal-domain-containing protein [Umbelopsis sp. PMI_123]|nr:Non-repetitive/WGA-negative nucleoporin C-terminal-domain-containing protein [Umbelopsis sp. PMI_123]